jgi:hypothetical protein
VRPTDAKKNSDFVPGTLVAIRNGTVSGASLFSVTSDDDPVIIGTTELTFYKLNLADEQFVTLKSYGALGNNSHNDTAALLAADAAGGYVFVTPGDYIIDNVILTKLKGIIGIGRPTFRPSSNVPTGATQAFLILLSGSGCDNAIVSGIDVVASKVTYPNLYLICASQTNGARIEANVAQGGGIGIYGANCTNHRVAFNSVIGPAIKGIGHDGASQGNVRVTDNDVDATGCSTHAISFQLGAVVEASRNYCKAPGVFGVEGFQVNRFVATENEVLNSGHEAINTEDSSLAIVTNNIGYWDVGQSTDLGLSIFGNAVDNQFSQVRGNVLVNSNSAGIALSTKVSFAMVQHNLTLNCCRAATTGAIHLSGSNCLFNVVTDNYCIDTVGGLQLAGVQEVDAGNGLPSLNTVKNNFTSGWTTRAVIRVNALAPAALAVNTDNYAPTSGRYYDNWNVSASGAVNLTGIADGWADRVITLYNAGSNTITLKNNTTSSNGNRFFLGADFSLTAGISISLKWQSGVGGGNGGWVRH